MDSAAAAVGAVLSTPELRPAPFAFNYSLPRDEFEQLYERHAPKCPVRNPVESEHRCNALDCYSNFTQTLDHIKNRNTPVVEKSTRTCCQLTAALSLSPQQEIAHFL